MDARLDLNITTIYRRAGQDVPGLAGFFIADRPRRKARSRRADHLAFLIRFQGAVSLAEDKREKLLLSLMKTYYRTSGSVTSAMREVAESLNEYLLKLNSQDSTANQPIIATLTQIVYRAEQVYLAQSGSIVAYFINEKGVSSILDAELSGSGLGVSENAPVSYFHAVLALNDTLILSSQSSPAWNEKYLSNLHGHGPESIRRRLLSTSPPSTKTIILQAKPGKGHIVLLHSLSNSQVVQPPSFNRPESAPAGQVMDPSVNQGVVQTESASFLKGAEGTLPVGGLPSKVSEEELSPDAHSIASTPGVVKQTTATQVDSDLISPFRIEQPPLPRRGLHFGSILLAPFRLVLKPIALMAWLLDRIIPGESMATVPTSTLAVMALVIPIVIVTITTATYIQHGVVAQSQVFYEQALELYEQAKSEADPLAQRDAWARLIDYLDSAQTLHAHPGALELRREVQKNLDQQDMIIRVGFQPAIFGGFREPVEITRIIVGDEEIYLLDRIEGKAYRATLTDRGYVLDDGFQCGANVTGVNEKLVDIVAWPVGLEPEASIMGLTADGMAVFCQPGRTPVAQRLASPSVSETTVTEETKTVDEVTTTSELTNLTSAVMDLGNLYVLDPSAKEIWIYWNGKTNQPPTPFFANQVPQLDDVRDMVVNNDELYLLHADGHLTLCEFSWLEVSPTRCIEPVSYIDTRPGRENSILVPEHPFSRILYNIPPDPSLYLLEPVAQSIYHFSLRNPTFQNQYLPSAPQAGNNATAFAVDTFNRIFFLALGGDVYYARMP